MVLAVVLHNVAGLDLGYAVGRLCGLPVSSRRAISIEVGMQNSGLAAALRVAGRHLLGLAQRVRVDAGELLVAASHRER
ncbi:hypothetical protein [Nocardioides luteus]|uniref:hypothetical protein n=1 Tax=Nocardioides luteus TaxID=1844 RepID=UPI001C430F80|nr:hypothetical protein [Nocardioides luteus]